MATAAATTVATATTAAPATATTGLKAELTRSLVADILKVLANVWDIFVNGCSSSLAATCAGSVAFCNSFQVHEVVGAQLIDDPREELLQTFVLRVPSDHVRVRGNGGLELWCCKVDHTPTFREHVDLFNSGDAVDSKTLELCLELLVVCHVARVLRALGAAGAALASSPDSLEASLHLVTRFLDCRRGCWWSHGGRPQDASSSPGAAGAPQPA
mmetsp:Transcript_85802/g.199441  ORF Transcript_85802/g.199441 Transcript_85802/m.199441 type:complete len:214 (-) Transcript_85802:9-650(-)